jgi:hypothetical protein
MAALCVVVAAPGATSSLLLLPLLLPATVEAPSPPEPAAALPLNALLLLLLQLSLLLLLLPPPSTLLLPLSLATVLLLLPPPLFLLPVTAGFASTVGSAGVPGPTGTPGSGGPGSSFGRGPSLKVPKGHVKQELGLASVEPYPELSKHNSGGSGSCYGACAATQPSQPQVSPLQVPHCTRAHTLTSVYSSASPALFAEQEPSTLYNFTGPLPSRLTCSARAVCYAG